ncbi:MAG TPA: GMC family oxidoreductase [Steroidobacteraceae bacterium]|nr:GMC family oxidoreductase [Steroidobacteraceae bacterium]
MDFDAIVVGSGITGGWVARELCARGLKTLVLERGRNIDHAIDYQDFATPWEVPNRGLVPEQERAEHYAIQSTCHAFSEATKQWWVRDSEHPYTTPADRPFSWIRGYHLGGRSITWGRQSYRMSDYDFNANKLDGNGIDWPIRYADLSPWYDRVERFAGISGANEGLDQLPDGQFLPPLELNCLELAFKQKVEALNPTRRVTVGRCAHLTEPTAEHIALGRGPCQMRSVCERGCGYGGYFSSLSATLPAARKTGNLTIVTDAIVERLDYDHARRRISGVRVIDAATRKGRSYQARVVFLCASTIGSTQIMLASRSEYFPNGLANRSDALGRYLMDHVVGIGASGTHPGFLDRYYYGRRPTGFYLPRYVNITENGGADFVRGFGFQGYSSRSSWSRGAGEVGVGAELKQRLRSPGRWEMSLFGFGEMLPRADNRVKLHASRRDNWGIPLVDIDCTHGENERRIAERANRDAAQMLAAAGFENIVPMGPVASPGQCVHEMGTARMGHDPATSVLNRYNQAHDVSNLFVTDGSCMTSSGSVNPSLTYMALSARAANHAADLLASGEI